MICWVLGSPKLVFSHLNKVLTLLTEIFRLPDIETVIFFGHARLWVDGDTGRIFLFELKYVMGFRNTGFN